ncbi:MAG: hypothetical protein KatS3mg110_3814 [Pirellulaceae bacterium]|nr:MAG: hypothetical protein KatS3mg110_3814 [Pirellulaceae bacterium]
MLEREEYIEQAYFFNLLHERIPQSVPLQDVLQQAKQELLASTRLPLAVDYLLTELNHSGAMSPAMRRLGHYFTAFQTFIIESAEDERGRFDMRIAVQVLKAEAEYRAGNPTPQGSFVFQFETLARNRLSYDRGLAAMAEDPIYSPEWREWILTVRRQIGLIDFADLLYVRSAYYWMRQSVGGQPVTPTKPVLFGEKEGKIAWANRRKDPLYLFAALQRQLGYPKVPRPTPPDSPADLVPQLLRRLERLELRLRMLEEEQRHGAIDFQKLQQYYQEGKVPPPMDDPSD